MVEEDGGVQMVMLVDNTELDIQENRRAINARICVN
jgi:hypothetical protein